MSVLGQTRSKLDNSTTNVKSSDFEKNRDKMLVALLLRLSGCLRPLYWALRSDLIKSHMVDTFVLPYIKGH